MEDYDALLATGKQAAGAISDHLRQRLTTFVAPLLEELDAQLDARLVRTFQATLEVLLRFRHRQYGLLLSELGAWLLSPDRAPAGTKRLSNLLRSAKWQASVITDFLWEQAAQRSQELQAAGQEVLVLWDESVLEKPESQQAEGLGPVRSSKGKRLTRPRRGCFRKPGPPIMVPGLQWISLLVLGSSGPPTVATMRWFTPPKRSRTPATEAPAEVPAEVPAEAPAEAETPEGEAPPAWSAELRPLQRELLQEAERRLGRRVLHIWDRGAAGSPWLGVLLEQRAHFVIRWPKRYQLLDGAGELRPTWKIAQGKRSWGHQRLWDPRSRSYRRVGVLAFRVRHPDYPAPLWLVIGRARNQKEPWYLLTSEPVHTQADAWRVVRAYARRWQIELSFRYTKSELALESPRLWKWENRVKLLLMVTVVYAFLLRLLARSLIELRTWLLRYFCHRTGRRLQAAVAPLYRLREALSHLWLQFPAAGLPAAPQTPG
jgi:hypothetical protein